LGIRLEKYQAQVVAQYQPWGTIHNSLFPCWDQFWDGVDEIPTVRTTDNSPLNSLFGIRFFMLDVFSDVRTTCFRLSIPFLGSAIHDLRGVGGVGLFITGGGTTLNSLFGDRCLVFVLPRWLGSVDEGKIVLSIPFLG